MQLFRSFAAQYILSPLLSMAATTSDSIADDSSSLTDERRAALAQALLEVLTEHREHSSESGSEVRTFSDWTFREQLAEFIQQTKREIDSLKAEFSVLNPFYNHNLLPSRARRTNKKYRSHHASSCSLGIWCCHVASNLFPQPFTQLISRKHAAVVTADSRSVTELRTSAKSLRGQKNCSIIA